MSLPYLLLGMLETPAAGYDLKRAFDGTLRHFWTAELSQIYPALQRLEREGLLRSERTPSPDGPARRVYERTAEGTRALREWVARDPIPADVRLPYLGQLCFHGMLRDPDASIAFLTSLRAGFVERARTLAAIEAQWFPDVDQLSDDDFYGHLTLLHGHSRMESSIAWCDDAIARIAARKERSQ